MLSFKCGKKEQKVPPHLLGLKAQPASPQGRPKGSGVWETMLRALKAEVGGALREVRGAISWV